MKLSSSRPWMAAPDYGHSLTGLTVNLLVRDVAAALPFHHHVLAAFVVYHDEDFAVLRFDPGEAGGPVEWMLHADHTYRNHPLSGSLGDGAWRGLGIELRLHGRDPDDAETEARRLGHTVLSGAADKPHGLREAHLVDPDGYVWVPDLPCSV